MTAPVRVFHATHARPCAGCPEWIEAGDEVVFVDDVMLHADCRLTPSPVGEWRLVSVGAASARYDVTTKTIRRRIADGTITGYRVGVRLVKVDLNECDQRLLHTIPTPSLRDGADRIEATR